MTRRRSSLLVVVLALSGCGLGAQHGQAEPSGAWSLKGEPVGSDQVQSDAGPEHCGWQEAQFLGLSWPPGRRYDDPRRKRLYVKDPKGVLGFAPYLRDGYRDGATLPDDAVDTGYRNSGYALWYSAGKSDEVVYVVHAGKVEVWPKATTPVGCD